jgi:fatty-acid peroxygenase
MRRSLTTGGTQLPSERKVTVPTIPRDKVFDGTISLLFDPYGFISKRCRRLRTDLFETRLMLRRTICMSGAPAARLFYDERKFIRRGAMPERIRRSLLGRGGVQGLDGAEHRHRKRMFMSLMTPERVAELSEAVHYWLRSYSRKWASMDRVLLDEQLPELLTRAVCAWSGVPLAEEEVKERARELTAMFKYAGAIGPKHWWSRLARMRAERRMATMVERVRTGELAPAETAAAYVISLHRDADGRLLDPSVAAVEILNVLRPTVAVTVFIEFIAHALHAHPECRQKLAAGDAGYADMFVQEIRRFYPFFPAVAAVVRDGFEWNGYKFSGGRRVLLDLHGTNRDRRTWEKPERFLPKRFAGWQPDPFTFIPQGGGDHFLGHRCAGEWICIELMKVAATFLATEIAYSVPEQDLRVDTARLPALPRSGLVITNVLPQT